MTGRKILQQPSRWFRQFLAATAATNSIPQSNWSEQWCPAQRPEPWHQHEPHRQEYTAGHLQAFLSPIFKIQHSSKHNSTLLAIQPSTFKPTHTNSQSFQGAAPTRRQPSPNRRSTAPRFPSAQSDYTPEASR